VAARNSSRVEAWARAINSRICASVIPGLVCVAVPYPGTAFRHESV
jgi:hypothetical protein